MGSGSQTTSATRKARIEEMRRAEVARERRNRFLVITGSLVAVAAIVAGGVFVLRSQSKDDGADAKAASSDSAAGKFATGADGVRTWTGKLGRTHVTKRVHYPTVPPVGGDHHQVWMNCDGDVYTEPVDDMNAVHSLEHGAVWVTYNSKAPKADVAALAAKVEKTPYTLMSPDDDQADPIMLTAWGHQRTVTGASDANVDKFLEQFVQGAQTPEPGAACTGGLSR
ncbi:DUF3105 domain-containing protein [Streptomyces sp. NBC_00704]|uniref:DUF3105 domain-containing protein n=1 Tax=Streptomyces sp. NBC_00704 TaxID=2975809 RepID=UPI002E30A971|nr:DUF3105 domain-containing protein [Streptomyces sp. NBC_00704]